MLEIKIGGRLIPLNYTTYELIAIQKDIGCTAFELKDKVFGIRQADEDDPKSLVFDCATDPEKMQKLGVLIRILGNAGLEESGKEPDLTDKWVLRNIKPNMIVPYAIAVLTEIVGGNSTENTDEKENVPVDEGLEEQNEKKSPGS